MFCEALKVGLGPELDGLGRSFSELGEVMWTSEPPAYIPPILQGSLVTGDGLAIVCHLGRVESAFWSEQFTDATWSPFLISW